MREEMSVIVWQVVSVNSFFDLFFIACHSLHVLCVKPHGTAFSLNVSNK